MFNKEFFMNTLASPSQLAPPVMAGWHGANDITTLIGLRGMYSWGENPMRAAVINFRFDPGREGYQGTYTIVDTLDMREDGVFYCAPNNFLLGWASNSFPTAARLACPSFPGSTWMTQPRSGSWC